MQLITLNAGREGSDDNTPSGEIDRSVEFAGIATGPSAVPHSAKERASSDDKSSMLWRCLGSLAMGFVRATADPLRFSDGLMNASERLRQIDVPTQLSCKFRD
jgi:hypothetical protein